MGSQVFSGSAVIYGGYTALGAGTVAMVELHVVTGLDPVHTVISEYAFEPDGWLLPVSLAFFAAGATAFGAALVRRGTDRGAAALVGLWGLCMLLIGAFPTDAPGLPLSVSGGIHRYAAFVAFLAMPGAGLILARRRIAGSYARLVRLLSLASLGVLVLVVLPYVARMFGVEVAGGDIPAGVIQRLVVIFEVAVLLTFGLVLGAYRPGTARGEPGADGPPVESAGFVGRLPYAPRKIDQRRGVAWRRGARTWSCPRTAVPTSSTRSCTTGSR